MVRQVHLPKGARTMETLGGRQREYNSGEGLPYDKVNPPSNLRASRQKTCPNLSRSIQAALKSERSCDTMPPMTEAEVANQLPCLLCDQPAAERSRLLIGAHFLLAIAGKTLPSGLDEIPPRTCCKRIAERHSVGYVYMPDGRLGLLR
jgi:hypothetical protein